MPEWYLFNLSNEVDHNEMEDNVGEDEVSEASLWGYVDELTLVSWVHLEPKTDAQNEWCHTGNESAEEGIERKSSHQTAIHKLEDSSEEDVGEVGINNLQLLGGVVSVVV